MVALRLADMRSSEGAVDWSGGAARAQRLFAACEAPGICGVVLSGIGRVSLLASTWAGAALLALWALSMQAALRGLPSMAVVAGDVACAKVLCVAMVGLAESVAADGGWAVLDSLAINAAAAWAMERHGSAMLSPRWVESTVSAGAKAENNARTRWGAKREAGAFERAMGGEKSRGRCGSRGGP